GGDGNAYGVANVGGVTVYERCYDGNPLVNALAAGMVRHDAMRSAAARIPGNLVLYVGATTGRDGILGAAFASEQLGDPDEHHSRRSHVQVADPFMGRKLMESCLSFEKGLMANQDLGACGIACAASEMAAAGGTGIDIDLTTIPVREQNMDPDEILLSESQERFLFVIDAAHREEALRHFRSFGVNAVVCGVVTDTGYLRARHGDEVVVDLPASFIADEAPPPSWEAAVALPDPEPYPDIPPPGDLSIVLLQLLAAPGIADSAPVYRRYDQTVGNRTVRGPGQGEAAVLKLPGSKAGFALSLEGRGDGCAVNPYLGTQAILGKTVRNLGCVGAEIVAITDGINAGSPSDPVEYLRLIEVIRGLGDGLRQLQIPVTGGNCSLYNESPAGAIPPTPMIGAIGLIADVDLIPRPTFEPGEVVFLIGELHQQPTLSTYGRLRTGSSSGPPPAADLDADRLLASFLISEVDHGRIRTAKDGGTGGLAAALAKLCIRSGVGAGVSLTERWLRADWLLFGEYPGTAWITTALGDADTVEASAGKLGIPIRRVGTTGGDRLRIGDAVDVSMTDLTAAFRTGDAA
ncbi:MAG: AIR synthase-related protein, partial [Acidimicrobiia bacterium]